MSMRWPERRSGWTTTCGEGFVDHQAELLAAAETGRVEAFERRARDLAKRLAAKRARSDADELERQRVRSSIRRWTDKTTGMKHTHLELDPLRDSALWSTLDRHVQKARQDDANAKKPWAQLQIDTLIDTVTTGAAVCTVDAAVSGAANGGGNGGTLAVDPAQRVPEATVLIDIRTLTEGVLERSVCELEDGTPLPVDTMRRLLRGAPRRVELAGRGTRRRAVEPHGHPSATASAAGDVPHLCPPGLHRRVRGVPHPPHPLVVARPRPNRPRQPDPTVRAAPPPRPRRRLGVDDDPARFTTWTRPDGSVAHHGTSIDRARDGVGPETTADRREADGRATRARARGPVP